METVKRRVLELRPDVAKDIVNRFKEGYYGDDMTLLVVQAHLAIQFIETWLELSEHNQSSTPAVQGLKG